MFVFLCFPTADPNDSTSSNPPCPKIEGDPSREAPHPALKGIISLCNSPPPFPVITEGRKTSLFRKRKLCWEGDAIGVPHTHTRSPSRHCSCTPAILTTQRQTQPAGKAKGRSLENGHSQSGLIWEARPWRGSRPDSVPGHLGPQAAFTHTHTHTSPDHFLLSHRPLGFSFYPLPSSAHQQRLEKKEGCLPRCGLP